MARSPLGGTNLERAKAFNRRVVVEALRRHAPASRAELARLTHLSPQTISNIVGEFLAVDLVRVAGRREGRPGLRGQPQIDLALNADAAVSIGLSLEHDRVHGTAINLDGAMRAEWSAPVDDPRPPALLPAIEAAVAALRREAGVTPWGVGIAMPGPFAADAHAFSGPTTLPGWEDRPVARLVGERIGLPVRVERDAAAAARAEFLFGAARDLGSFFVLHFGLGLGGSAFADGQIVRGARGNAGEIGLLVVEPGGRPHPGGPDGCLEAYVSLHALKARLAEAGAGSAPPDPDHPVVRQWVREAALRLRPVVGLIETVFDPETIIVGGRLGVPLTEQLVEALAPLAPSIAQRPGRRLKRVVASALGPDSPALGAAALCFYDWLAPGTQGLRKAPERGGEILAFGTLP